MADSADRHISSTLSQTREELARRKNRDRAVQELQVDDQVRAPAKQMPVEQPAPVPPAPELS